MSTMFRAYRDKLLQQLSLDLNCTPADLLAKENIITVSALKDGRRSYSPGKPFLEMATLGGNTVMMADPCLHDFLNRLVRDTEGHRLFELDNLIKLNEELRKYGYQMSPTHHMFLPDREITGEERCRVRWLYDREIDPFYGDSRFPMPLTIRSPVPSGPTGLPSLRRTEIPSWGWRAVPRTPRTGSRSGSMSCRCSVQGESAPALSPC